LGRLAGRPLSSLAASFAVFALIASLFVLEATSIRGKSLTYDAPQHLSYGLRILHADATRFDDSKMPVSAWNALPKRLAETLEPGALRSFLAADSTARYPTMLASLALAWLVFHWSRQLYGLAAGLLSLTLEVFDPNLLAHSRFVTTDLYAALTVTLSLYTFWRFLEAPDRRAQAWRGLAAAFAFGLAQVAKYTGAYLVPVLLMVVAARFAPALLRDLRTPELGPWAARLRTFVLWAAVFGVAAVLVINGAFLFQDPFWPLSDFHFRSDTFRELRDSTVAVWPGARLPLPYPYIEGLDWVLAREQSGQGYGNRYLLGEIRSEGGFPGYYFVAALFKVPAPILIVWLAALVAYPLLRRRGARLRFSRDEAFLLLPAAFLVVYFNFFFGAQIGIRFLLPVFPLLHVFAGCLVSPEVWGPLGSRARRSLATIGGALGIWLAASVLSYYPDFLPYMNELLADRKLAYHVLADSNLDWGQDRETVDRYRTAHPEVLWQPREPAAGRILVGINWLTGVSNGRQASWLRARFEPVDHLHYTHLIFQVSEDEAARARDEGPDR